MGEEELWTHAGDGGCTLEEQEMPDRERNRRRRLMRETRKGVECGRDNGDEEG
jgi:hypothetical protein